MKQLGMFGNDKEIKTTKKAAKKSAQLNLFADSEFFAAPAQGTYMYGDFQIKMELTAQDNRTEEQKATDRNNKANSQTVDMFSEATQKNKTLTPRQQIIREAAILIFDNGDIGGAYGYCVKVAQKTEQRLSYWNNSSSGASLAVMREAIYNSEILFGVKENNRRSQVSDLVELVTPQQASIGKLQKIMGVSIL